MYNLKEKFLNGVKSIPGRFCHFFSANICKPYCKVSVFFLYLKVCPILSQKEKIEAKLELVSDHSTE